MVIEDSHRLDETISRAYEAIGLKDLRRTGWVLRGVHEPESVADHSWGTALLSLFFLERAGEIDGALAREKVLALAIVHDLAEVRTGDIPRRVREDQQPVSRTEKRALERAAISAIAGSTAGVVGLWEEYERAETLEARYVRDMNLVDMCLQALRYEEERRYDPEVGAEAFPDYEAMDEFFATSRDRFSTGVGRATYTLIRDRYMSVRGSSLKGNETS